MSPSRNDRHLRLRVPTAEGVYLFPIGEITRLEANSNYTYIHFVNRKPLLISKVLKVYDALLSPLGFIRTHQSHLVNPLHVRFIDRLGRIEMVDSSRVDVSRSRKKVVLEALFAPVSSDNLHAILT